MIGNMKWPPIEHGLDGSLPHMTPKQHREANTIIRRLCSYYDFGNCLYLDRGEEVICLQSISYSVNCKFFRHVLLEDKDSAALKAELFNNSAVKRCEVCGKPFASASNRAKYCPDCAAKVHRRQKNLSDRKRRSYADK